MIYSTFIYNCNNINVIYIKIPYYYVIGYIDQALLCYKKSLSLKPPRESLGVILLNKAAIEQAIGNCNSN